MGQQPEQVVWLPSLVLLVGRAQLNQGTSGMNFPVHQNVIFVQKEPQVIRLVQDECSKMTKNK
jgi:hypothetical protein